MTLKKRLAPLLMLTLLVSNHAFSGEITVIGSLPHNLTVVNKNPFSPPRAAQKASSEKVIQLLRVDLSQEAKERLKKRANRLANLDQKPSLTPSQAGDGELPNKTQVGMNKVPVLDQGRHGTCVTFAVTAALDASLGRGDYISQLCHLQLGTYLENHGYSKSGWNGSSASNVINQIDQYGIVNKTKQKKIGCGDLTEYPLKTPHSATSFIEPDKFNEMSELLLGSIMYWSDVYDDEDTDQTLNEVKKALAAGDRLVFAFLLPRVDLGTVGAVGKHKTWFAMDSWVLTPEILKGLAHINAAHEVVITGYDDNAVAIDENQKSHKGLLKLRNSWGRSVGDNGEFYMSYDYFKLLAFDVTRNHASTAR